MIRGCPVTGRMMHRFDLKTHRCVCGRWERGFKPKKESTAPVGECQICERHQCLSPSGTLVNHGYTRPGCGFIVGPCYGCGYKPYPETSALEKYAEVLARCREGAVETCEHLAVTREHEYHFTIRVNGKREPRSLVLRHGDEAYYNTEQRVSIPSFATHIAQCINTQQQRIVQLAREAERVAARIKKARAQ